MIYLTDEEYCPTCDEFESRTSKLFFKLTPAASITAVEKTDSANIGRLPSKS